MSDGDLIEWRPPSGGAPRVPVELIGGAARAGVFCLLVMALHHAACRALAPGSESPLGVSIATVLALSVCFLGLFVLAPWLTRLDRSSVSERGVHFAGARERLPWAKLSRFRIIREPTTRLDFLVLQKRNGELATAALPEGGDGERIVRAVRQRVPEDPSLDLPRLPAGLQRSVASALIYGGLLLGGAGLAALEVALVRSAPTGGSVGTVLTALLFAEVFVGPGAALSLYLWRRGCGSRLSLSAGCTMNLATMLIGQLFALPLLASMTPR
jgi:hypothetical protein